MAPFLIQQGEQLLSGYLHSIGHELGKQTVHGVMGSFGVPSSEQSKAHKTSRKQGVFTKNKGSGYYIPIKFRR